MNILDIHFRHTRDMAPVCIMPPSITYGSIYLERSRSKVHGIIVFDKECEEDEIDNISYRSKDIWFRLCKVKILHDALDKKHVEYTAKDKAFKEGHMYAFIADGVYIDKIRIQSDEIISPSI